MNRNALYAALVLALAAGPANAAVTEFVIYKQENFRGASKTVKGEVANLEGGFAREGSSLVVRGGNWEVCTDHHFRGSCYVLGPGEYPSLAPELHHRIVAVRFVGNNKVATQNARGKQGDDRRDQRGDRRDGLSGSLELYGRQDFRGRSVRVEDNQRDLARKDFDGRASSAVVHEGTWELCTEPGFGGRCQVYRPGQYRHLAGLDDRVSSARQVR